MRRGMVLDGLARLVRGSNEAALDTVALEEENKAKLDAYAERVARINDLEPSLEALSDKELRGRGRELRQRVVEGGEPLDDVLEEAFALVREAAWRVLELRHYDVQVQSTPVAV